MKDLQNHTFEELDIQEDDLEFNQGKKQKKDSGSKLLEKE